MRKKFKIPFQAKACSISAVSPENIDRGHYAFKVHLASVDDPKSFAETNQLVWSDGLQSLYRYSEESEAGVATIHTYFDIPPSCHEVIIEPVQWKDRSHPIELLDFNLAVYGNWSKPNLVTIIGEECND